MTPYSVDTLALASRSDGWQRWLTKDPLPASLSKVRQALNSTFMKAARAEWALPPPVVHMLNINPSLPSKGLLQLISSLPRRQASLLVQLRTEHAPLNYYLH